MNNKWRNRAQWTLIVGVFLAVVKQVANLMGYPIPDPTLDSITNVATTVINALAILGILSSPPQTSQEDNSNDQSQNL